VEVFDSASTREFCLLNWTGSSFHNVFLSLAVV
jgi:hypothetical protein